MAVKLDSAFIKLCVCVKKSNFLSWAIRTVFVDPVTYTLIKQSALEHNLDFESVILSIVGWIFVKSIIGNFQSIIGSSLQWVVYCSFITQSNCLEQSDYGLTGGSYAICLRTQLRPLFKCSYSTIQGVVFNKV